MACGGKGHRHASCNARPRAGASPAGPLCPIPSRQRTGGSLHPCSPQIQPARRPQAHQNLVSLAEPLPRCPGQCGSRPAPIQALLRAGPARCWDLGCPTRAEQAPGSPGAGGEACERLGGLSPACAARRAKGCPVPCLSPLCPPPQGQSPGPASLGRTGREVSSLPRAALGTILGVTGPPAGDSP